MLECGYAQRGFSLLELLVALFVVVLLTSMVTLSVNTGGEDIRLEATVRDLAEIGRFALDEAQIHGWDYGLRLEENLSGGQPYFSYSWRLRGPEGWREPPPDQEVFSGGAFPPDIELELELNDSPFTQLTISDAEEASQQPQVVFYASGETTVGALNVRRRSDSELLWRVQWDLLGRFEVLLRGEEDGL